MFRTTTAFLLCAACTGTTVRTPPESEDTGSVADTGVVEDTDPETDPAPALYAGDRVHSPLTPWVVDGLLETMERGPDLKDDVFMKVGASGTVSHGFLHCFVDDPDLGDYASLSPTLEWFLGGDAAGTTPFDRETEAAKVGASTVWAVTGDPSPVEIEIAALSPRFALIAYGTNDMQLGTTYHSASHGYAAHLLELVDLLLAEGIVPVVSGVPQRSDSEEAAEWVPTYDAIARSVAQARQVPFLDLFAAYEDLPGYGLAGDGIHSNQSPAGACAFSEDDLAYRANTRNLITLEALDRLRRALLLGEDPDEQAPSLEGDGSPTSPFVIPGLPFGDLADTSTSPWSELDSYPSCSTADESGPELRYALELDHPADIRAIVFDQGDVDVDLHILDEEGACVDRAHQLLEVALEPGRYQLVVDSWVDGDGVERSGAYMVVVVER